MDDLKIFMIFGCLAKGAPSAANEDEALL